MAIYKFPLQKLLDIRTEEEEQSKRAFMEALRQKKLAEDNLEDLKLKYKKFNVLSKEDDIFTKRVRNNYLNALKNSIEEAIEEVEKNIENVNDKRETLKKKQVERKTVEILKEKRQALFLKEEDEKERKANDEFALYAYLRTNERR